MKRYIRSSENLGYHSIEQVTSKCKQYIQKIADDCLGPSIVEIQENCKKDLGCKISDGICYELRCEYSLELKLANKRTSDIIVKIEGAVVNDEFLSSTSVRVQMYTPVSGWSNDVILSSDTSYYSWWDASGKNRDRYINCTKEQVRQLFSGYDSVEKFLPKSKLMEIFTNFKQLCQQSEQMESVSNRSMTWKSLIKNLTSNSLYEQDESGEELTSICRVVEDKLGYYVEPSVQGRQGGVWIYDNDTNEILVDGYDYETFNDDIYDLALESSNKKEFMTKYRNYLENLI